MRVAVLFGGRSAEHEISILSARFIVESLDRERYEPVLIGIDKSGRWLAQDETLLLQQTRDPRLVRLNEAAPSATLTTSIPGDVSDSAPRAVLEITGRTPQPIDVVFPVLHGPMGEDGTVQGLLTLANIAFVGSGVLGSAVGMDKDVMKRLLRDAGLPIVPHVTVSAARFACASREIVSEVLALGDGSAVFIKPANLGSSVGVSRATTAEEVQRGLSLAFTFDRKVVVELGVRRLRELECAVLGNDQPIASRVGEIVVSHPDGFYSYAAKYVDENGATTVVPADLPAGEEAELQRLAIATFRTLECAGLARVDFFRGETGTLFVNEVNTMPGFTAISMYPKLFEASGLGAKDLVSRLCELAIERARENSKLRSSF